MNTNLLNQMGLAGFDMSYLLIGMAVILLILIVIMILQNNRIRKITRKYEKFMTGKNAKSLEKEIMGLADDNSYLREAIDANSSSIKNVSDRLEKAYQKAGVVKYNAFEQMGAQLSYSIALLDADNDGFILNSVHSTDGCYSYAKEIKDGKCDITLGKEEQEALLEAMNVQGQ
jgi:biopolymer transport protein ExbB/TolQ